jgi:hypothetical protein
MKKSSWRLADGKGKVEGLGPGELKALFPCMEEAGGLLGKPSRRRLFSPENTFFMFLWQVLNAESCACAVLNALGWFCRKRKSGPPSPSSSACCQGRQRLSEDSVVCVFRRVRDSLESQADGKFKWMGGNVRIVDGSTVTMADTPENQKEYPQHKGQKKGCGFPIMRILAVFSLATGALLHMESSCFSVGEQVLFRQIRNLFSATDVILSDRGFCSYADFCLLMRAAVDMVARMKTRIIKNYEVLKILGRNCWCT